MNQFDPSIDKLLNEADGQLASTPSIPAGDQIRQLATKRRNMRRRRRASGIGIALVCGLLAWNSQFWSPPSPEQKIVKTKPANPLDRKAFLTQYNELMQERVSLEREFSEHARAVKVNRIQQKVNDLQRSVQSVRSENPADRAAWVVLQQVLPEQTETLQINDRQRLRAVTEAFPLSEASDLARSILNYENPEIPFQSRINQP